jgi:catechol 2,3-dioxygenase-like lactoylglutathione lyase family enzyme
VQLHIKSGWIKALALLACVASSLLAAAQAPPITGIAHLAFRVHDLGAERAFFRRLGFEEAFVLPSPDNPSEVFIKINDRQFIELYPQTAASQPLGWMHVCYESDALNSLQELYATHGLKPSAVQKAGAGNLLFSLNDPEGRVTEFTQYMPGSRHTLDRGKHLGQQRIATELLGFSFPSADLAVDRQFYTAGLGFEQKKNGSGIRLRLPAAPDLRIALHAAKPGDRIQAILGVSDVPATASALRRCGFSAQELRNAVSVQDPNGNLFVFAADTAR